MARTSSTPLPPTRTYTSDVRAAQVIETRRRIRAAAEELFLANGYVATSMDAIAKAAGVSRQTVFTAFGSKSALLSEIGDVQVVGDDLPVPLAEREAMQRLQQEEDPIALVGGWMKVGAGIMERTAPSYRLMIEAAPHDPEVAKLKATVDENHLGGMRQMVDLLASNGHLRKGRSRARAAEAAWLVMGYPTYLAALAKGWSGREYERWAADCLVAVLVEPGP
jgi:AcrR family transcriptional regulator